MQEHSLVPGLNRTIIGLKVTPLGGVRLSVKKFESNYYRIESFLWRAGLSYRTQFESNYYRIESLVCPQFLELLP